MTKIQTKNRIFNLVEDEIHFGSENIRIFRWGNDLYFEDSSAGLHPLTELLGGGARVATVVVAQDGTGDVSDIQEGIDSLPSSGGLLWVREGTYEIYSTIGMYEKSNIHLIFNKGVIIKHQESLLNFVIRFGENIRVSGLNWDGGGGEQPSMILITDVNHFSIDNSIMRNSRDNGIALSDCNYFNIERVLVEETGEEGIHLSGSREGNLHSSIIRNSNQLGGADGAGIHIHNSVVRSRIWGNLITDETDLMDYGIWDRAGAGNGENLILGNTIKGIPTPILALPSDEVAHNVCV